MKRTFEVDGFPDDAALNALDADLGGVEAVGAEGTPPDVHARTHHVDCVAP